MCDAGNRLRAECEGMARVYIRDHVGQTLLSTAFDLVLYIGNPSLEINFKSRGARGVIFLRPIAWQVVEVGWQP